MKKVVIALVRTLIPALVLTFASTNTAAQEAGEFLAREHILDGDTLLYRIMYPVDFDESKKYPLVLFMHGAGERGSDNKRQLVHGSKLFVDSIAKYPAVVIFPQCPRDSYWASVDRERRDDGRLSFRFYDDREPTVPLALVMDLMNETMAEEYIDPSRIYIAGLSMGGMGTWEMLWRMPETFAAAMPICGGGARTTAVKMTDVPIWALHGKLDDIVPVRYTVNMVTSVQEAGGIAKVTVYPNANHNSWDPAFAEPKFFKWMFSHSRNR